MTTETQQQPDLVLFRNYAFRTSEVSPGVNRCRRHRTRRPSRRHDGGVGGRGGEHRGSDTLERPSVTPERWDDSLRGIVADPMALARVAERLGV